MNQNFQKFKEVLGEQKENRALIFSDPYREYSQEDLLRYYRERTHITCFSVPDAEETRREKINSILENLFEFNNESHILLDPVNWKINPSRDIQWHICFHKFYYSVGLGLAYNETGNKGYLDKWVDLTTSWIDQEIPSGFIASHATGRRIQNWVYAYYHFVMNNEGKSISPDFNLKFLTSLHQQTLYLRNHLSPTRNHRTLELYAVFLVAVVFPEFQDSKKWLEFSLQEIVKNIQTDLLDDGVQCELSTHYHHVVLKNYLCIRKLASLNQITVPKVMDDLLIKALEFAMHAHKPDGFIPSLSDGDTGTFLTFLRQGYELYNHEDLLYVATQGKEGCPPKARSKVFKASGYCVLRSGWGDNSQNFEDERYLIFDCGPLGRGNHGHLDLLSFEMSAYGNSLVVDPGRYTYDEEGETNWRVLFRGTGYHNTVQVDKMNQTRYVPGENRYKIKGPEPEFDLCEFVTQPDFDFLHGVAKSHEYEAVHERKIFFVRGKYWIIFDHLLADEIHDYDQLFHLSPQAFKRIDVQEKAGTRLVRSPHLIMANACDENVSLYLENGYVSGKYGEKHSSPVARFSQRTNSAIFHTILYPYKHEAPDLMVKRIPVHSEDGLEQSFVAQALSINSTHEGKSYTDICFSGPTDLSTARRFGDHRFNGSYLFYSSDSSGDPIQTHMSQGSGLEKIERLETARVKP